MFDSLDEQMKHDDAATVTRGERLFKYALWAVVPIVVFGAVFVAIMMMQP